MIPENWIAEHEALNAVRQRQIKPGYEFADDEEIINDKALDALNDLCVTSDDLAALATIGRGQYRDGDTRRFVSEQEQRCVAWNCWMVREPDGTVGYSSESPGAA
jgi:hypothetical protein